MKYFYSMSGGVTTWWLFGTYTWFSTTTLATANMWSVLYGNPANGQPYGNLTFAEIDEAKRIIAANLAALPTGSGGGYNPAESEVVDEAELGAALTSAVTLINQQSATDRDAIIAKINGLSLAHN